MRESKWGYIYRITHKKSGKTYIGSTARVLRTRWLEHKKRLRNNNHLNPLLQDVYNREGLSAFEFRLIERCPKAVIEAREQYWRDKFASRPCGVYNTGDDTATPFKGRSHSAETRDKIRETLKKTLADKRDT